VRKSILFAAATCVAFAASQSAYAQEKAQILTPGQQSQGQAQQQAQSQTPVQQATAPAVNGTDVGAFFNSGAVINPEAMERASIPADNDVDLGPSHNIKAPKPGEQIKKNGFIHGIGRAFAHTANFIGFPVGDDHDVDASLSSNLQNEENRDKIKQIEASQEATARAAKAKQTSESTTSSQQ
jgi:hypothetical protein